MKKDHKDKKEKKSQKKRSFLGRLIVGVLTFFAVIGLIAMVLSVASSYIDPIKFVWTAYFGLAFWVVFFYNLIVLTLLLLMWSKKAWVAVLAILISIPGVNKSFSYGKAQVGGNIRLMTYNVHYFSFLDGEKTKLETAEEIAAMVNEYDPDLFCIQEFTILHYKMNRQDCLDKLAELLDMPYYYYNSKENFAGNVIFSKYPLKAVENENEFGNENTYGTVTQVDAGENGKFILVCCHLQSFQFTDDELSVFSDKDNSKEEVKTKSKSILSKLKTAYEKRSREVDDMLADIPHDGRPIVLCGDFNDTPLSYTYHQIKRAGFTDGFVKAGRGVGRTYAGKLPMLRIDYVWCNDQIQPMAFKRLKVKGSDHFPVMMDFNVNHGL